MLTLVVLAAIFLFGGVVLGYIISEKVGAEIQLIGNIMIFISGVIVGILIMSQEIDAIDVYRGKTELEITETVRDTVVVKRDTVVVFKKYNKYDTKGNYQEL